LELGRRYEAAQAGLNDYEQHLYASGSYSVCSKTYTTAAPPTAFTGWVQASNHTSRVLLVLAVRRDGARARLVESVQGGIGRRRVVRTFASPSGLPLRGRRLLDQLRISRSDHFWSAQLSGLHAGRIFRTSPATPGNCTVEFDSNDTLTGPVFSNTPPHLRNTQLPGDNRKWDTLDTAAEWAWRCPYQWNGCGSPPKKQSRL